MAVTVFTRDGMKSQPSEPWLPFQSGEAWGALILSAMQPSRLLLLLKALLQSGTPEWEVQSSPCFWEQPPTPSPAAASTGSPHDSGSGSPQDFTNAWPVPSTAQLGGLSSRVGKEQPSSLPPSPLEGRATLVRACPSEGGEPGPSLLADFPAWLSQGTRRRGGSRLVFPKASRGLSHLGSC